MIEVIWNSLLELRSLLSSCDQKNFSVQVIYSDTNFHLQVGVADTGQPPKIQFLFSDNSLPALKYCWDESFQLIPVSEPAANPEIQFIHTYLPYCFSTLKSHKLQRAYTISHLAQSLNGFQNTSKYSSAEQNLVHRHRLRALNDSVLIGLNTLRTEKPDLAVRLVKGNNPVRVVIGSSVVSFSSLMQGREKIIFFTTNDTGLLQGIDQVSIPETQNISQFVLESLYKMGIHSVFIEGGPKTVSNFLQNNMVDEVQVYSLATITGSGKKSFNLPRDWKVNFSKYNFTPLEKGVLFTGTVKYNQTI